MKLALLLLCHEPPQEVAQGLRMAFFCDPRVKVYIHYDARRSNAERAKLASLLQPCLQWRLLDDRLACRWGEYSLVEATRRLMQRALEDASFDADYVMLISGSCVPIRPLSSLLEFLRRRRGMDFIQAHDISIGRWVKDGLEAERFQYFFPFNFIESRRAFEMLTSLQRRLRVLRAVPSDLQIHFGSQWFCLTKQTASQVVSQLARAALRRFFRHSWIPDEFAVQTLVAGIQSRPLISGYCLTYYEFDGAGRPLVLQNGHERHLARQPFFFARKLAPEATALRRSLDVVCTGIETDISYFDRVGSATIDYRRFIDDVAQRRTPRSALGTAAETKRGSMESNRRRYYVLVSSSTAFLRAVMSTARIADPLPIFDFPFDTRAVLLKEDQQRYFGLQTGDVTRREYDPSAFLFELVQIDAALPSAFGHDLAEPGRALDLVRHDGFAVVVDCDPPGLSRRDRAAATLRDASSSGDEHLADRTRQSLVSGTALPRDIDAVLGAQSGRACHVMRLHDADYANENRVIRAIFAAARRVDHASFFEAPVEAARRELR